MNLNYYKKIQNAHGTSNRRERELAKVNRQMEKHFNDTFDTESVVINGSPRKLMIIKDTDGNVFKKKIKSVHNEKFNLGDYVIWNDQVWIVTLIDSDEKTWNRGYMYLCTVVLRWQNENGEIIERWAYSEDFTKYSGGTSSNNVITVGNNQYGITLPIDSETKRLKRDMRFPIDFEDSLQPDIYRLTNRKVKLNDNTYFNRGGTMVLVMTFDSFNEEKDKHITTPDGRSLWMCDYIDKKIMDSIPSSNIDSNKISTSVYYSGKPVLRCGGNYKQFVGNFVDKNGIEQPTIGKWKLIYADEIMPYIKYTITDNVLKIKVIDDLSAVGGKIRIIFSDKQSIDSTFIDLDIISNI